MTRTALQLALIQTRTPAQQAEALEHVRPWIEHAAADGAQLIVLPECANLMEARPEQKAKIVTTEDADIFVLGVRDMARRLRVDILIGSVIVTSGADEKVVNRSLMVGHDGEITARYDKIHLFDADTPDGKTYRESASVTPGDRAVVADTSGVKLGLSICYDLRFASLYRALAKAGAEMMAVPAAFTVPTGRAHWEVLLRARAIETGCFVLAAAQGGPHADGRTTYGHSMVVSPWGEVVASLNHDHPAILTAKLDMSDISRVRAALPSLRHDRAFSL
ncbi:MAG: carbon-nitrogen hydrolase family protein [Asticcacaulis sp.]